MDEKTEEDRLREYIEVVERVIDDIKEKYWNKLPETARKIVELSSLYLNDAQYYLEKRDWFTSLACIAYAEGLLDALRFQNYFEINWNSYKKTNRIKVLVGGVFDILHPGHVYFLKEAWKHGRVYVVVARDSTVVKLKNRKPLLNEESRRTILQSIKYVYKAFLGKEKMNIIEIVKTVKPQIIFFGPDQKELMEKVKQEIERHGIKDVKLVILDKFFNREEFKTTTILMKFKEFFKNSDNS